MKFAPYTSGRLRKLKVGITSDPNSSTALNVLGGVNIVGVITANSISISTTTATSDFANLNITGVSTFSGNINANGNIVGDNATNISGINSVTATKFFGDGSGLENTGATLSAASGAQRLVLTSLTSGTMTSAATDADLSFNAASNLLSAGKLFVSGISTFVGFSTFNNAINVSGVSTFSNSANAINANSTTSNAAINILLNGNKKGSLTPKSDGLEIQSVGDDDVSVHVNSAGGNSGDFIVKSNGSELFKIDGGTLESTFSNSINGDLIIGTPTGGFKTGAFTINNTDKTKDSINDLNNILGKLVPAPPTTINGQSISLTGTAGNGRLCAGFTPTNNTGGSAPVAGTQYTRNTDSTVSTNFLTEFGPGDSGTVTGFVNAVGVGTTTLTTSNNDGTYGSIQIANNEDASNSTRNTGIASGFYQIYDLRMVNGASPDGFNLAKFTQGSSTTASVFWYEDPSTVGAPVISFGAVNIPASPTLSYSSGIPHYTESTNNNFTYVMTVTNATGDMYTQNSFVNSDGQTGAFQNPGGKSYTNFASGTNPPARNYGVGTGVTTLITQTPRNLHATVTSNIFTSFDASTPYGSHNNQRVGFTTDFNIMGTTADFTNNVDEDAIECTVGSLTGGSATRVPAVSGADNPSQSGASYSWGGGSAGSIDTFEAAVRGGDLRHDQTDYSTGYLPVGPDYSSGRGGSQYFQFQFIQSSISEFKISYTGSLAGCWVCMPDNSTWTTSLSGTNGWADMFQAYKGSGVPTTAEPGCSSGGVMDTNGGTFTCVFGTESSSNDSNNRVLIRFKLTSGNSISDISLSDT